ncbi:MAG: hypothetical protein K6U00_15060, partial [Armatimonadetes bacterium]|nr:hypothetical protein [Armatimonadota bacterium]
SLTLSRRCDGGFVCDSASSAGVDCTHANRGIRLTLGKGLPPRMLAGCRISYPFCILSKIAQV